jgi:cell wall-associated NlpC family hydrolase
MQVVSIAREWLNTPYADHQSVKGVYCDCVGFLLGVAHEMGHPIKIENYNLIPRGDSLIQELDRHLIQVEQEYPSVGDILCFKTSFRGVPTHVGIATNIGLIHADSRAGKVVETSLGYWERLIVGYWVFPTID